MLTSKVFMRKTKRGNIIKIVREHYLRNDIWCGSRICKSCTHYEFDLVLDEDPENLCSLFTFPHYIVLDTNVVLDQIDILEEDIIKNIIVLHTVLDEVKHKSSSIYKRFKEICSDSKRNFYTFVNEHHK